MTLSHKVTLGLLVIAVAGGLVAARTLRKPPTVAASEAPCSTGEACRSHAAGEHAPAARPVQGKPRMLVFSSASCPVCQRMAPRMSAAEKACDAEADVVRLDVDEDPGEGLAALYAVPLLPSFVNVDASGREVSRLVGIQPRERLEQALEEVRGSRCAAVDEPVPSGGKGS